MKRIALTTKSILIAMFACLISASSSFSQEPKQGAYFDPNDDCNHFTFTRGNAEEQARAKKACEDCAGTACQYVEKVYQLPACLKTNCKNEGNTNSNAQENRSTETNSNQTSGVSLENDEACPAPNCRYELDSQGRKFRGWTIQLERPRSGQSNSGNQAENKPKESDTPTLEETLNFIERAVKDFGKVKMLPGIEQKSEIKFNGCEATLEQQDFREYLKIEDTITTFNLIDLNEISVLLASTFSGVKLATKDNVEKFSRRYRYYTNTSGTQGDSSSWRNIEVPYVEFFINTKENAERLRRALMHASSICRSKQPKDPF